MKQKPLMVRATAFRLSVLPLATQVLVTWGLACQVPLSAAAAVPLKASLAVTPGSGGVYSLPHPLPLNSLIHQDTSFLLPFFFKLGFILLVSCQFPVCMLCPTRCHLLTYFTRAPLSSRPFFKKQNKTVYSYC